MEALDMELVSTPTGQRIRQARQAAGLRQAEVGRRMGVTAVAICQYERGHKNPKLETIRRIAHALECPVSELVSLD